MAGRQHDAAKGLVPANHRADRRRRQNAALTEQHARHAVGRRQLEDGLHRSAVVIAAITAQHQGLPGQAPAVRRRGIQLIHQRLDEIFQVPGLGKHCDFFAQA